MDFFFLLWNIFVCSPFGMLTKQLDNWRHVFFMWESDPVIDRENAIFCPQLLFMGSKCQNYFSLQSKIDKSNNMKSACTYFRSLGAVWEFKICLCDSGSQLSALKCECVKCIQHPSQESRWISQLNLPIIKSAQWVERCTVLHCLITILLKNTGVVLDAYKMEDDAVNKFVS